MTCREKLKLEHPELVHNVYEGGCHGCPHDYGYLPKPEECTDRSGCSFCTACWDREIPETEIGAISEERTMQCGNFQIKKNADRSASMIYTGCSIKDSGDRTEFATGAVRDMREGKGRCDLMPLRVAGLVMQGDPILDYIGLFQDTGDAECLYFAIRHFAHAFNGLADMLLEVAKHFEEGAKKYGENNWQKGIPVHCYIDSAVRHYLKWLRGDKDEPHDRAFVWNLMCCIWEVDYSPRAEKEK